VHLPWNVIMTVKLTRKILGNHSDDEILILLLFCLCADYRWDPRQGFKAGPLCIWMQHDSSDGRKRSRHKYLR